MTVSSEHANDEDPDNVVPLRRAGARPEAPGWLGYDDAAPRDALTNLAGHPWFDEDLRGAARRRRGNENPWVAVAKLAGLGEISQRLGPEAATAAIQAVAVRLHEALRGGDKVARIGPERFGLIVDARFAEEATSALERIEREVRDLVAANPRWEGLHLRVGVAPLWAEDPAVALQQATGALERALGPMGRAVVLSTGERPSRRPLA